MLLIFFLYLKKLIVIYSFLFVEYDTMDLIIINHQLSKQTKRTIFIFKTKQHLLKNLFQAFLQLPHKYQSLKAVSLS